MNLEQWYLTVDNASNIWMAGLMTVQTLILIIGAWIAYKEFVHKQNEPSRLAASKLFKIDYLIDSELEWLFKDNNLDLDDCDFKELFSNFPKKYLRSINKVFLISNKIFEKPDAFEISELESELEVLKSEKLRFLFYDKIDLKKNIEGVFMSANSSLFELNFLITSISEKELEEKIKEIFKEVPSHSSHKVSRDIVNYWRTKKEIQLILRPLLRPSIL